MNNIILLDDLRRQIKVLNSSASDTGKILLFPAAAQKPKMGKVISFPKSKPE